MDRCSDAKCPYVHYVLDAYIWKFDKSNPRLREYLLGGPPAAAKPAAGVAEVGPAQSAGKPPSATA